jgi:hypothetical protein
MFGLSPLFKADIGLAECGLIGQPPYDQPLRRRMGARARKAANRNRPLAISK